MNQHNHDTRWRHFLTRFYAKPNDLQSHETNRSLQDMVTRAHTAWTSSTPTPFFLPARIGSVSYCYVLCPSEDREVWIRDLIRAYLGSWIEFNDLDSSPSGSPLDDAVAELIGSQGCRYIFSFPSDDDAPQHVLAGLRRLTDALATRPHRRIALNYPLGRLIGDFWDACAAGSEATARYLLDELTPDHRLSRTNALFLRLQALATFQRWDQIEKLDQLPDLLRMERPARVSDALARLAMAQLKSDATLEDFNQHKPRYGALISSVTAIRSAASAQYYAYWCLSAGESAASVRAHLLGAGWLEMVQQSSVLKALLLEGKPTSAPEHGPLDRDALNTALADGRLDAAIALLATAQPTSDAVPILHELVLRTLAPEALKILQRWREVIGDTGSIEIWPGPAAPEASPAPTYTSFDDAVSDAFSTTISAEQRQYAMTACRESAVAALMRPGALTAFARTAREQLKNMNFAAGEAIDLLLDIERDLYATALDRPGIQDLRLLTIDTWAYSDESGDRHRASRVIVLLDRLLAAGVSVEIYDEVVDLLHGAWTPYLTDADTPLGLEAIEILAASKPDASTALNTFALPVLSRIGDHNVHRLESSSVEAARVLGSEFGLELVIAPAPAEGDSPLGESKPPDGTFIAIYSLMESAANRTKRLLKEKYPGLRVEVFHDKVGSDALRSAGKSADILVIADRAAAHAATGALVDSRGDRPIDYARGKGTASLLEAVDRGLQRLLLGSSTQAA